MIERRKLKRSRCALGARVVFNARASTLSCTIRNHCEDGVLLTFGETPIIPDQVELLLDRRSTLLPAQVVWRRGSRIGLAFPRGRFMNELREDAARSLLEMQRPAAGTSIH